MKLPSRKSVNGYDEGIDFDYYADAELSNDQKVAILWRVTSAQTAELRRLNRWVTWGLGFAAAICFAIEIARLIATIR